MTNPFYNKNVVSIKDFTRNDLEYLFHVADNINSNSLCEALRNKILGLVFFEPSTRTRLSFESAMNSLGGTCIGFSESSSSSTEKGENLNDTLVTMNQYVDALVLRHQKDGVARFASEICTKPVINAGSGTEEHPTQAMLDLYTIFKELGTIDNLNIGIFGDLKYGRTVYSLLYGLSNYNPTVYLISPDLLQLRSDALSDIREKLSIEQHSNLSDVISKLDVIYTTRIQKERFPDIQEYERVKGSYRIDESLLKNTKDNLIILHPMPRSEEIPPSLDTTKYAKYFKQIQYGKLIRSALLYLIFTEHPEY